MSGAAAEAADVGELGQLLGRAHQLAARALHSSAQIREEDVEVLAEAYHGLGGALDFLLPGLRTAARIEEKLQWFESLKGRRRGDRGAPL